MLNCYKMSYFRGENIWEEKLVDVEDMGLDVFQVTIFRKGKFSIRLINKQPKYQKTILEQQLESFP